MSLGNGLWLLLSLVPWYVGGVGYTLSAGLHEKEPLGIFLFGIASVVSLVASVWLSTKNRKREIFWVLLPLGLSFAFVFISGLFRGKVPNPSVVQWIATGAEVAALATLTWQLRPNWFTAAALAAFCSTFWLFALFMSSMAFTDTWL